MSKESAKRSPEPLKETYLRYSVGIDMSKDKFDACLSLVTQEQKVKVVSTRSFKNHQEGFAQFVKWVESKWKWDLEVTYTMEATGVYYEPLAWFLNRQERYVSVVLPNKARRFMQSIGLKSKNDKIDSIGLAVMGGMQRLERWQAPDEEFLHLRFLTRHRQGLQENKTIYNNQLHALKSGEYYVASIAEQLTSLINLMEENIKETDREIKKMIDQNPKIRRKVERITAIHGVGALTVITIAAETSGFSLIRNQRQLVSYAGYDVVENQSGKHVGKTKISKKGNAHIRRILHMPSFSVVTNKEPVFKSLYDRVFERSRFKMKAYVAVQRKLLILIYTLWNNDQEYIPNLPALQSRSSSFGLATNGDKQSRWTNPPTLDELPYNAFAGSPLSLS